MKTTQIHLLRASAIGLWLYATLVLGRIALVWANLWHTMSLNGNEAYIYGYSIIEIVSIAIICFTLYGMRHNMPKLNKSSRVLLHIVGWYSVFSILQAFIDRLFVRMGWWYIYPTAFSSIFISVLVGVLVWLISSQTSNESLPKGMPSVLVGIGSVCVFILLLIAIAAGYIWLNGHVFGFNTYFYITWLKVLAPVVILPWYAVYCSNIAKK